MTKNYYRYLFALLLVAAIACKKNPQNPLVPVSDFDNRYLVTSNYDAAKAMLTVDIKLDDTVHAYADGEKIGKPIRLEITAKNGWAPDGDAQIPQGVKKNLAGLGYSMVLRGQISIHQKLKKGTGEGEALLHLQVCADNACDRPRTHKLSFE